jgi:hypothetical protein
MAFMDRLSPCEAFTAKKKKVHQQPSLQVSRSSELSGHWVRTACSGSGLGEAGLFVWWQVGSRIRGLSEAKMEDVDEGVDGNVVRDLERRH